MLPVLQTRPDLILIVIGGLLALIIVMVKLLEQAMVDPAAASAADRRRMIESVIGVSFFLILAGALLPTAISQFFEETCSLIVEAGETYLIDSGEREEYCNCTLNGTLKLQGTVALSDTYE